MANNAADARDLTSDDTFFWLAVVLTVFALLCFVTSASLDKSSRDVLSERVAPTGGVIGPITTTSKNQSYHIEVSSSLPTDQTWKFVTVDVLDQKKDFLFAFGKELWKQSGIDEGQRWSERVTRFEHKFTLQERGSYYLKVNVELGNAVQREIRVHVKELKGSGLAHFVLAIIAGALAVLCGWIYYENC